MTRSLLTLSEADPRGLPGFRRTYAPGRLTLGLGFPLKSRVDRDEILELPAQAALARVAEAGGFAAVYARDIPLRVPSFGDVGQIYDPWVFLTHIAAHTSRIALGTAGIVLPVRHPLHVAKAATSLDQLSGGRFLLGLASGDRPEEFRAFGIEQGERGAVFREHLRVLEHALTTEMRGVRWSGGWMHSADVVPKPSAARLPLFMTGTCQQSTAYLAKYGDGYMTYPREHDAQRRAVRAWRDAVQESAREAAREASGGGVRAFGGEASGGGARASGRDVPGGGDDHDDDNADRTFKPFAQSLQIDLSDDPGERDSPIPFGFRLGSRRLVQHLTDLREIGVDHVQLGLGASRRPVREVMEELSRDVVPHFPAIENGER